MKCTLLCPNSHESFNIFLFFFKLALFLFFFSVSQNCHNICWINCRVPFSSLHKQMAGLSRNFAEEKIAWPTFLRVKWQRCFRCLLYCFSFSFFFLREEEPPEVQSGRKRNLHVRPPIQNTNIFQVKPLITLIEISLKRPPLINDRLFLTTCERPLDVWSDLYFMTTPLVECEEL